METTEIKVKASGMGAMLNKNPVGTYAMGIGTEMPDDATMKKVRETWKSLLKTVDNMMKTAKKTQRQTHSLMVCIDFMKAVEYMEPEFIATALKELFHDWLNSESETAIRGRIDKVGAGFCHLFHRESSEDRPLPILGAYMEALLRLPNDIFVAEILYVFRRWRGGATPEEMLDYMLVRAFRAGFGF